MSSSIHDVKRAFTLKSGWLACAIMHGRKPFENRSDEWPPGWYAMHVGVAKDGDAWAEAHVRECCPTDQDCAIVASDIADGLFPKAAIVGLCRVSHCLPPESCNGSPWALGPVCNVIDQTLFIHPPIENVRGQLGLWSVGDAIECRLAHLVGRCAIRVSTLAPSFPADPAALMRARERRRAEKRKRRLETIARGEGPMTQTLLKFAKPSSSR